MNISRAGEDNAVLLAVSVILQGQRTTGELTELINHIMYDIKEDGVLESEESGTQLINGVNHANLAFIRTNLEERYNALGSEFEIPDFEKYITHFVENTAFEATNELIFPAIGEYGTNSLHPDTIYIIEYENGNWLLPENLTGNVISGFRPYINGAGDKIVCYGTRPMDSDYEIYLLSYDLSAGAIAGKVTTEPDSQPLESVLLFTEPGGYITLTDSKGFYDLRVPPGNYRVTAHVNCFESSAVLNVAVQTGNITEQDLSLLPGNCFPEMPANPSPPTGASNQDVISLLQWECSDPDLNPLSYDVLLGVETEHHIQLEIASSNQTTTFYQTKPLNFGTTYYWQIDTTCTDVVFMGDTWQFTTEVPEPATLLLLGLGAAAVLKRRPSTP